MARTQLELGSFDSGTAVAAEASRRTELMADAVAASCAVHEKGLAISKKRVVDALVSFSTVGDCGFDSPGHHGTPLQRERAAAWGADLAVAAQPRSLVLPADVVIARFDAALPRSITGPQGPAQSSCTAADGDRDLPHRRPSRRRAR